MSRLIRIFIPVVALIMAQIACVQDCMAVTFHVAGRIVDQAGNPVPGATINAYNEGSYELAPFNVTALSDMSGHFETEAATSYACTYFQLVVTAAGFKSYSVTYVPPGEQWPDELPAEMIVTLESDGQ
jgi:hypothetical protein